MDRGAWKAAVHGVAEGWTWLGNFTFTFHFHALEKEMATHSSVLAWRIPGTGEPGGLPSMESHRVGHDWSDLAAVVPCPVLTVASWTAYRFLRRQARWSGIPISWRIFQFVVIYTVKGFGITNKVVDVFIGEGDGTPLQYSCLENPMEEEPGRPQPMGSLRVGHNWATSLSFFHFHALETEMATHSSVLSWRIPGAGDVRWADVYGVTQSRARLKWLSSSSRCFYRTLLLFWWSNGCWQFDLWFLCLFKIQLEHLEVHGSQTVEAWLGEFWALLC